MGVVQLVNKVDAAEFSEEDETGHRELCSATSIAILNSLKFEATRKGMQDALASVSALGTKLTAAEQSIKNTRSAERLARQRMLGVLKSSKVLSAHHDLRELFGVVMHEATDLFDAQRATLFLVDERANELWSLVAGGTTDEIRFPMGSGIAGHVATSRMTSRVNDAYADPRFNSKVDKELGFFTKNILAAPVMRPGDASVIGVVQVINKCDRGSDDFVDFEEEDAAMIEAFCAQIGFAVEQSQNSKVTQSKLEKSAKTLEGLRSKMHDAQAEKASIVKDLDGKRTTLDIARRIGGAQKLDDLFNTVAHEIRSILGVDRVTLFVVDHVKGIIWSQVAEGTCERFTIRLGKELQVLSPSGASP